MSGCSPVAYTRDAHQRDALATSPFMAPKELIDSALVEKQVKIRQNGRLMKEKRWHENEGPLGHIVDYFFAHLAYAHTS